MESGKSCILATHIWSPWPEALCQNLDDLAVFAWLGERGELVFPQAESFSNEGALLRDAEYERCEGLLLTVRCAKSRCMPEYGLSSIYE